MKKLLLTALSGSIVVASSLTAGDWYIGASVAGSLLNSDTTSKNDTTGASATTSQTKTKAGIGFKGGYGFDASNSIDLEYISVSKNMEGARLNYVYQFPTMGLKTFIGGGVGFVRYKEDFSMDGSEYSFDKSAPSWNLKGGIIYKITGQHEIALGYDYIGIRDMSQRYTISSQPVSVDRNNVNVGRLYAEYNYHF